ncbi:hypothetical protein [Paenibacillus luteus]|uniref:hypothetical protein n=1 Tax=Paenibacillus luteus TaxID=2545753 RepID=UPI001142A4C1|nr:hypothetical protein [Paenibacillus luteus]
MASKLTLSQLVKKVHSASQEELVELAEGMIRNSKEARAFASIRLRGEEGLLELASEAKAEIDKEMEMQFVKYKRRRIMGSKQSCFT